MVAVLLCITGAGAYVGSAVVARHRAQAAADLAALTAAARLPSGVGAACALATAAAHEMRVDDVQCEADDLDVVVTVQVAVVFAGAARAVARAGPVSTAGAEDEAGGAGNAAVRFSGVAGATGESGRVGRGFFRQSSSGELLIGGQTQ
jgi:secretion/DNA translocation related TadE-like protein